MSIIDQVKSQQIEARKSRDTLKSNLLSVVIGTAQQENVSDDEALQKIIKKIIKANQETLSHGGGKELEREVALLSWFLPETMSQDEIESFILKHGVDLKAAPNEGVAMGFAMKALKTSSKAVDSKDVKEVVRKMRDS